LRGFTRLCFRNYRNTAITNLAGMSISADIAIQASGHISVQMHKRYLDLERRHIARAFGLEMAITNGRQEPAEVRNGAPK
jgi:hypothetical protein